MFSHSSTGLGRKSGLFPWFSQNRRLQSADPMLMIAQALVPKYANFTEQCEQALVMKDQRANASPNQYGSSVDGTN